MLHFTFVQASPPGDISRSSNKVLVELRNANGNDIGLEDDRLIESEVISMSFRSNNFEDFQSFTSTRPDRIQTFSDRIVDAMRQFALDAPGIRKALPQSTNRTRPSAAAGRTAAH